VRFGGDEFAVLLPGIAEAEAVSVAERVRDAVSGSTRGSTDSLIRIPVEISMGIAQLGENDTFESLLRAADAALYRAKRAGRNAVST
jgi:diguanylate cyclase (GGDEF)-like protein